MAQHCKKKHFQAVATKEMRVHILSNLQSKYTLSQQLISIALNIL